MWAYEISPILGKKMSDDEKQARRDKIAQNKLNNGDNRKLYRVGWPKSTSSAGTRKGSYIVATSPVINGVYSVKKVESSGTARGTLYFLSKREAWDFNEALKSSDELKGNWVISVPLRGETKQRINDLTPIETKYGKALIYKQEKDIIR